jgi:hypothetical protein|uniref:Uncharacterized protein n=1 Tax=Oryza nivara TaxID=4536 RepID=A0A0E0IAD4_ORYNI
MELGAWELDSMAPGRPLCLCVSYLEIGIGRGEEQSCENRQSHALPLLLLIGVDPLYTGSSSPMRLDAAELHQSPPQIETPD